MDDSRQHWEQMGPVPADPRTWPTVLTVDEAASLTGLDTQAVRRRLRDGTFRGRLRGRRWLLLRDELVDDLAAERGGRHPAGTQPDATGGTP
jgi:excisionase family DNA binding protein